MAQKRHDMQAEGMHHLGMCGMSKPVVAVVSSIAWMAVSSALILLNKDLLSHGFHYPVRGQTAAA